MSNSIYVSPVPEFGPLSVNAVYRRADLHARFGGSRYCGIVRLKLEPVLLLFHTEEPGQQFYRDGFAQDGLYWYSGEGAVGDMTWTAGNRAVRDHVNLGLDLFFFERAQRKDGLWRFAHIFHYVDHKREGRIDKTGNSRSAIIFGLLAMASGCPTTAERIDDNLQKLRVSAMTDATESGSAGVRTAIRNVYIRSEAVRRYVLGRAAGSCEACGAGAPFKTLEGMPFLEVHHIDRLADDGPDRIDRVAAICPNCHRRCHYGSDQQHYNSELRSRIARLESPTT
jgi:5-methylcytosine-specific restriction enzyme A